MQEAFATSELSTENIAYENVSHKQEKRAAFHTSVQNLAECIAEEFEMPLVIVLSHNEEIVIAGDASHLFDKQTSERIAKSLIEFYNAELVFEKPGNNFPFSEKLFFQTYSDVQFSLATPIITIEGERLGALVLADFNERFFSVKDRERLKQRARLLASQLYLVGLVEQERKLLQENETQLTQAFQMANIGMWTYNVRGQKLTCSKELFSLTGLDNTTTEKNLLSLCFAMVQQLGNPLCDCSLEASGNDEIDRIVRPDGSITYLKNVRKIIFNEFGKPVTIIGIAQDITEHLVYEEKLKESEERFRALVQNSSDMTAVLDEAGNIKYISPTSLAISGYAPEELIGRNVFSFMHEDDMAELVAELQNVADSVNSGEPTLHRFRTKNGPWIWLESKGMNMTGNSHVGGIIINAREVTERIHLEERLALEEQNRQRAITSAVIKAQESERSQIGRELHDNINQVLTTVKLYTELICDGIGEKKELGKKAGKHLQDCIDEIRSISKRLSAPTLGEIGLGDSIAELVESINLTNRIKISYSGQGVDGLQIPQELHLAIYRIIQEQLNNTLKYAMATQVSIVLKKRASLLTLYITDNGKGFDLAAKRTGIGITNMRTRAENQNGVFHLDSSPGRGCRLKVIFPLPDENRVND